MMLDIEVGNWLLTRQADLDKQHTGYQVCHAKSCEYGVFHCLTVAKNMQKKQQHRFMVIVQATEGLLSSDLHTSLRLHLIIKDQVNSQKDVGNLQ